MELVTPDISYYREKHLISRCIYHIIFCSKYRRKVLISPIDERLKELIYEKQNEYDFNIIELEIMPDHVHLLLSTSAKNSIYSIVSRLKGYTSNTLRAEFPSLKSRLPTLWTKGKFISSVGSVLLETVKKYIEDQKGV
ncbi:MAG: IS200/IS605 family transposase [Candidatus Nanoarchaeia archaeon]|nr:IS200/IS605 family transposase [Candidatus Nanoarchaeia archaeon]